MGPTKVKVTEARRLTAAQVPEGGLLHESSIVPFATSMKGRPCGGLVSALASAAALKSGPNSDSSSETNGDLETQGPVQNQREEKIKGNEEAGVRSRTVLFNTKEAKSTGEVFVLKSSPQTLSYQQTELKSQNQIQSQNQNQNQNRAQSQQQSSQSQPPKPNVQETKENSVTESKRFLDPEQEAVRVIHFGGPVQSNKRVKASVTGTVKGSTDQPSDNTNTTIEETALSMDHIRNKIFGRLTYTELKQCRLVSPQWNVFVTPVLEQRTLPLTFVNNYLISRSPTNPRKTLRDFADLLNHPKQSISFLAKVMRFESCFNPDEDEDEKIKAFNSFQIFMEQHGSYIEELSLGFGPNGENFDKPGESEVYKPLENLLLRQARNLRYLSLCIDSKIQWSRSDRNNSCGGNSNGNSVESYSALRISDPEYKNIHTEPNAGPKKRGRKSKKDKDEALAMARARAMGIVDGNSVEANPGTNNSLKVVNLRGTASAKIMELIIKLAPNLERIIHMQACYHFFVKPVNRTHLLKEVCIDLSNRDTRLAFKTLEKMVFKENLKLREIYIRIFDSYTNKKLARDLENRAIKVINRLLETSWNTLETIVMDDVSPLGGLKWPGRMPKVSKFFLLNPHELRLHNATIFPPGLDLTSVFPQLRYVLLDDFVGKEEFCDLINIFNSPEPLKNVTSFHVHRDERLELKNMHFRFIYSIFPNARFTRDVEGPFDYEQLDFIST